MRKILYLCAMSSLRKRDERFYKYFQRKIVERPDMGKIFLNNIKNHQCGYSCRSLEAREQDLIELANQYEKRRQAWIRKQAALEQKVYYLSLPDNLGANKLKRVRQGLIDLIQQTI